MKKKIAFLMASIMTFSMMPAVNSYAASENKLSNGNLTVSEKTLFYEPSLTGDNIPQLNKNNQSKVKHLAAGNYLTLTVDEALGIAKDAKFGIELSNAKFVLDDFADYIEVPTQGNPGGTLIDSNKGVIESGVYKRTATGEVPYSLTVDDETYATVQLTANDTVADDAVIRIPLVVRMDENLTSGTAKVSVRAGNSGLSSNSLVFATINKGSTNTYVNDVKSGKNSIDIDRIIIKENVVGSMNPVANDGFSLELPSGYYFGGTPEFKFVNVNAGSFDSTDETYVKFNENKRKLSVTFADDFTPSTSTGLIGQIVITGLRVIPRSTSDLSTSEDIKISIDNIGDSDMVTAQDFLAATRTDYNLSIKTSGTVPTLLNGYFDEVATGDKAQSVKIVVTEETAGSLIEGGDLVFSISDRAKVRAVKIEDKENIKLATSAVLGGETSDGIEIKSGKVTLKSIERLGDSSDKVKFTISFFLSIEPGYTGDVKVSVSGDALRNSAQIDPIVIAKAVSPLNVKVGTTYITPGKTTELGDIVLTEQLNSKGYSSLEEGKKIIIGFGNSNNYLSIVGNPTVKTENGLRVKDVKVTNTNAEGSQLAFTIDESSSVNKSSTITISGLRVAASSSIPQGDYELLAGGSAIAGNDNDWAKGDATFTTDGMTIAKLQYGGTVALKVTIGDKIVTVNGQEVEMKLAPFIDATTGTTYMQVSDIVKATGKTCTFFDNRLHNIDGYDKNLYVTLGDRTFEKDSSVVRIEGKNHPGIMTNEQGTPVNMIIKDDYTCLPLRYFVEKVLGQTISWNGTDNTITVE